MEWRTPTTPGSSKSGDERTSTDAPISIGIPACTAARTSNQSRRRMTTMDPKPAIHMATTVTRSQLAVCPAGRQARGIRKWLRGLHHPKRHGRKEISSDFSGSEGCPDRAAERHQEGERNKELQRCAQPQHVAHVSAIPATSERHERHGNCKNSGLPQMIGHSAD